MSIIQYGNPVQSAMACNLNICILINEENELFLLNWRKVKRLIVRYPHVRVEFLSRKTMSKDKGRLLFSLRSVTIISTFLDVLFTNTDAE